MVSYQVEEPIPGGGVASTSRCRCSPPSCRILNWSSSNAGSTSKIAAAATVPLACGGHYLLRWPSNRFRQGLLIQQEPGNWNTSWKRSASCPANPRAPAAPASGTRAMPVSLWGWSLHSQGNQVLPTQQHQTQNLLFTLWLLSILGLDLPELITVTEDQVHVLAVPYYASEDTTVLQDVSSCGQRAAVSCCSFPQS